MIMMIIYNDNNSDNDENDDNDNKMKTIYWWILFTKGQ